MASGDALGTGGDLFTAGDEHESMSEGSVGEPGINHPIWGDFDWDALMLPEHVLDPWDVATANGTTEPVFIMPDVDHPVWGEIDWAALVFQAQMAQVAEDWGVSDIPVSDEDIAAFIEYVFHLPD